MNMDEFRDLNIQGARCIVKDYLKLTKGEFLLIVCDETTREIADYVEPEAKQVGARVTVFQIKTDEQEKVKNRNLFPNDLAAKIQDAQCMLNILDAKPECTVFRKQLIHCGQGFGRRIAHAPGLRTEHLRTAFQADVYEMDRWDDIFVRSLFFARDCIIKTRDQQDKTYELHLDLGGKERPPAQSTRVADGSWVNIPGAEVYIAPIEESAAGDIIINGSMLGHVLNCDVLITFEQGKIKSWKAMDKQFQEVLDKFKKEWRRDSNWNRLCEFGIGLNHAFKSVTGFQLLDEKMGGTCHIAIGSNKEFGGKIESEIHQDFVTVGPTVIIDEKTIIEKGKFIISELDVLENLSTMNISRDIFVGREYHLTVRDMEEEDGKVGVELRDGSDQPFFLQVGDDATSRTILGVLGQLDSTPEFSYEDFESRFEAAPAILSLLLKYDFVEEIKNDE